jgi:hypothetical protein
MVLATLIFPTVGRYAPWCVLLRHRGDDLPEPAGRHVFRRGQDLIRSLAAEAGERRLEVMARLTAASGMILSGF